VIMGVCALPVFGGLWSPWWSLLGGLTMIAGGLFVTAYHRAEIVDRGPFCIGCGYDRRAAPNSPCPECGATK